MRNVHIVAAWFIALADSPSCRAAGLRRAGEHTGDHAKSSTVLATIALVCWGLSAACNNTTAPSPAVSSPVGRYTLVTVKGQSLPAVVSENPSTGFKQEVTAGFTELRADQTCSWSTVYRYTENGQTSVFTSSGDCTYTVNGSSVLLTTGRDQLVGTLAGNTLTVRADAELVYRRP